MATVDGRRGEWARLAQEGPVSVDGQLRVCRRRDVVKAATGGGVFRPMSAGFGWDELGGLGMSLPPLSCPEGEHARYRKALRPLFTPEAVEAVRGDLERLAGDLVGAAALPVYHPPALVASSVGVGGQCWAASARCA